MSLTFTRASSHYLSSASAVATAAPVTMACWFYSGDETVTQTLMALCDESAAAGNNSFELLAAGASAGDPIFARAASGANAQATAGDYAANVWNHAAGVFASSSSRFAYFNGTAGSENTTSITPADIDVTRIGGRVQATSTNFMSGRIAEAAIWNVALSAEEIAILAKGYSPRFVRPASLVAYWPLWGAHSAALDMFGGFNLTLNGPPTKAEHCRIILPQGYQVGIGTSAAPVTSGGVIGGGVGSGAFVIGA